MDVLQLGCGVCGLVCAEQVARHPKVNHMILADRRTDAAEALASRIPGGRASVRNIDGTDPEVLRRLLKDCDVVVASMPWRLNRTVLETAAKVGTDYVDFGMPFDGTGPEFDRAAEMCRDGGIAALVGMGMEPGISDVFAMHLAGTFDTTDEAHVFDGDTGAVEGLEFFSVWSPVDLLDEMSVPAAVFADGRIEFIPPMSSSRTYPFPEPVGPLTVYKTNHDETYFLPMAIPTLRHASFNIHMDDALVQAVGTLRKLGLLRLEPVDIRGVRIRPMDVIAAAMPSPVDLAAKIRGHTCFVVEVTGQKDGRKATARMWTMASYEDTYRLRGTNATAYLVGTGGATATEMLLDGEVQRTGLVIPEQLSAESYLSRLRAKGLEIREEIAGP
ncbi:MAG TPA: saccharopine dehydrogenase C-terminal domain-containing protein [Thermoplasmata archaeon]|nr:saccharopine dehydrogenase C-terminal domain-containing protein [Thermoplasmata archaeon]